MVELYDRLSPAAQRAMWALLACEAVLIVATERDIGRRAPATIRGPKLLWRVVATQERRRAGGVLRHRPPGPAMSRDVVGASRRHP